MTTCPHTRTEIPPHMQALPRDPDRPHFPVPWFVQWFDNKPDYRVADGDKMIPAIRHHKCWLCGQRLGSTFAFIIGPMCSITRSISEPPAHVDCAEFSVQICPFLTQPRMRRNEKDVPEGVIEPAGFELKRNPGSVCVWTTNTYRPYNANAGEAGILFEIGPPKRVSWWCEGRPATRAEVLASIESGLPSLREMAEIDPRRDQALAKLDRRVNEAISMLEHITL
jgi:hypothetical protein